MTGRDSHAAVEIHSIDTNCRIVFDSQVDVFAYTEAEVTGLREVLFLQLVFLDLQSTFEDFFGFGATDGDMYSNLFITADTERSDRVPGFAYW